MKKVSRGSGPTNSPDSMVNEAIPAREMRVISPDGEVLGVLSKSEALTRARDYDLDLVCVAPNAKPVVCKIMDYGKHLYRMKKKAKESKKKQATIEIKELKIRPNTDTHDLMTKVRHAKKFLAEGNKVKIIVWFRGREIMFLDKAFENLNKIIEEVGGEDAVIVELDKQVKNKRMTMVLTPKN